MTMDKHKEVNHRMVGRTRHPLVRSPPTDTKPTSNTATTTTQEAQGYRGRRFPRGCVAAVHPRMSSLFCPPTRTGPMHQVYYFFRAVPVHAHPLFSCPFATRLRPIKKRGKEALIAHTSVFVLITHGALIFCSSRLGLVDLPCPCLKIKCSMDGNLDLVLRYIDVDAGTRH